MSHPFAASNVTVSLKALYLCMKKNETEKKTLYGDRILQVEKGSFQPLPSCVSDNWRYWAQLHQSEKENSWNLPTTIVRHGELCSLNI